MSTIESGAGNTIDWQSLFEGSTAMGEGGFNWGMLYEFLSSQSDQDAVGNNLCATFGNMLPWCQ